MTIKEMEQKIAVLKEQLKKNTEDPFYCDWRERKILEYEELILEKKGLSHERDKEDLEILIGKFKRIAKSSNLLDDLYYRKAVKVSIYHKDFKFRHDNKVKKMLQKHFAILGYNVIFQNLGEFTDFTIDGTNAVTWNQN